MIWFLAGVVLGENAMLEQSLLWPKSVASVSRTQAYPRFRWEKHMVYIKQS